MKSKRIKTKETDAKNNVKSENVKNERSLYSRFTIHDSRFHIACLVFLIIITYSNTLNAPFQWDEGLYLVDNPIVKDLHYFTNPSDAEGFALYGHLMERYIGYFTFALNYKAHGFSVAGYHIVNIAIHIANSVLVYFLVFLTFRTTYFKGQGSRVKGQESKAGSQSLKSEYQSLAPCPLPLPLDPKLVAFFSAAIFAVHPLQTEAVTYVFQRFASLVTFFYLLSLVAYIKARLMSRDDYPSLKGRGSSSRFTFHGSRLTFFLISLVSAVLAMKTKENAFTLPIVIALYEFCFFSRFTNSRCFGSTSHVSRSFSRLYYLVPILLTMTIIPLTLIYLKGTISPWKHHLPGLPGVSHAVLSRGEYMFTQFRVIVTYLRLLFLPVNQNLDYDYPMFKSFFDPQVLLSFVFLFLLFGLGVYLVIKTNDTIKENDSGQAGMTRNGKGLATSCRHSGLSGIVSRFTVHGSRPLSDSRPFRLMGFGILWFFITLSVESSIIPLDMLIDEYRVYLPSIGIIISVVTGAFWSFSHFTNSRCFGSTSHVSRPSVSRPSVVFLVFIIGVLSVATYLRNEVWGDTIRLWEDTARKSPAKASVYFTLGNAYRDHNMLDKAAESYLIAIKLKPDYAEAYNNLGFLYQAFNMPEKAMEDYLIAVKLDPDNANAHFHLGFLYYKMGQMETARRELITGLKIKPDDQKAQQLLREVSR